MNNTTNNKPKYLLCISGSGSSHGAIRLAIEQIKNYDIDIELIITTPKKKNISPVC